MSERASVVASIVKAIKILNVFTEEEFELSLAELHNRTGIPKPTLIRLCNTLIQEQVMERDAATRKYRLGLKVLELALIFRSQRDVVDSIMDILKNLSKEVGETVSIYKIEGRKRRCMFRIEGPQSVRHYVSVGVSLPLHLGAAGKVILANLSRSTQVQYIREHGLPPAFSSENEFIHHLDDIKLNAFFLSKGERDPSLAAAAVPLFYHDGRVFGSLNASGPRERFLRNFAESQQELLRRCAKAVNSLIAQW